MHAYVLFCADPPLVLGICGCGNPEEATDYGSATFTTAKDGTITIEQADDIIGISVQLLADAAEHLPVDSDGNILLAGDSNYRYRPIRFNGGSVECPQQLGPVAMLICERVEEL